MAMKVATTKAMKVATTKTKAETTTKAMKVATTKTKAETTKARKTGTTKTAKLFALLLFQSSSVRSLATHHKNEYAGTTSNATAPA